MAGLDFQDIEVCFLGLPSSRFVSCKDVPNLRFSQRFGFLAAGSTGSG